MELNLIRSIVTLLGLMLFIGLMVWTWWPSRQRAHRSAAMLPFDGEAAPGNPEGRVRHE
jgi:cbb3-type cytochrome oxidase subunit 3